MRDEIIYEDDRYSVYQSLKGYDFEFYVLDKETKDWIGFLQSLSDRENFLLYCHNNSIDLPKDIVDSIVDSIGYYSVEDIYEAA